MRKIRILNGNLAANLSFHCLKPTSKFNFRKTDSLLTVRLNVPLRDTFYNKVLDQLRNHGCNFSTAL